MARSLAWMDRAACATIPAFTRWPWPEQLKLCSMCEVRTECLDYGMNTADLGTVARQGIVYGGIAPDELHRMLKKRAKTAAACAGPARLEVTAHLPHVRERREHLVENVAELLAARQTPEAIAARLGRSVEAIGKKLTRAGATDIGALFECAARRKQVVCDTDARRVVAG